MAWYSVKFSCGHEEGVQLFGKSSDRFRKIEYFEKYGVCSACYKEQQRNKMLIDHDEIEMFYGDYKKQYPDCKTKPGSYNGETKTIIVYVPKEKKAV